MQQEITRVALDAMGGDNAPGELVKGAVDAVNGRSDIKVLLVGQQDVVEKELKQYSYPKEQIEVVHAEEVIEMIMDTYGYQIVEDEKRNSHQLLLE